MRKPTYYLWRNDFSTQEEYETTKKYFSNIGFRIVTYFDEKKEKEIHIGLKALIKNYWNNL